MQSPEAPRGAAEVMWLASESVADDIPLVVQDALLRLVLVFLRPHEIEDVLQRDRNDLKSRLASPNFYLPGLAKFSSFDFSGMKFNKHSTEKNRGKWQ